MAGQIARARPGHPAPRLPGDRPTRGPRAARRDGRPRPDAASRHRSREGRVRSLEHLGVTPLLERTVVGIDADAVTIQAPDGEVERIVARTVIWAAGVTASGLAERLGEQTGADLDRAGRVPVEPDLTLPGHPEVFALGDMVRVRETTGRQPCPAWRRWRCRRDATPRRSSERRLRGRRSALSTTATRATWRRSAAPGRSRTCTWSAERLSRLGCTWLVVHLWYLIGFQNRVLVFIRWAISFFTRGRGARHHHRLFGTSPVARGSSARRCRRRDAGVLEHGHRGVAAVEGDHRCRRGGWRRRRGRARRPACAAPGAGPTSDRAGLALEDVAAGEPDAAPRRRAGRAPGVHRRSRAGRGRSARSRRAPVRRSRRGASPSHPRRARTGAYWAKTLIMCAPGGASGRS